MLCISAASHGRSQVALTDCLLLQHVFWHSPEERATVLQWLWDNLVPPTFESGLLFLLTNVIEKGEEILAEEEEASRAALHRPPSQQSLLERRKGDLVNEVGILRGILVGKAAYLTQQLAEIRGRCEHLW